MIRINYIFNASVARWGLMSIRFDTNSGNRAASLKHRKLQNYLRSRPGANYALVISSKNLKEKR